MAKFGSRPIVNDDNGDGIDTRALNELVDYQRSNNPRLQDMSTIDIAEGSGIGITTFKSLLNGNAKNPRIDTLKRLLRFLGGGSIDELVGLTPRRDYDDKAQEYNPAIVETLHARLDAKQARIKEYEALVDELKANNKKLREDFTAVSAELSAAKEQTIRLGEYRVRIKRLVKWLGIALIAILVLSASMLYFLWELKNPTRGNFQFY